MRTYSQIENSLKKMNFNFFKGNLNLNFVWERTSDIATNKFTDFLHIVYEENNVKKIITIPATTKPGLKGSLLEPVTVEGITGTAIIQSPKQFIACWQFRDTYNEFSKYPYFRQIKGIDYWRDFNKNNVIDRVQSQLKKIFGTHWHRMSNNNTYGSGLVNNWSLGCLGCPEPEFIKILPLVRKSIKIWGDVFTGTILETKNFE